MAKPQPEENGNLEEERVVRKEIIRLKEELDDGGFMAQRRMWHIMEERMRDARRELEDHTHVGRECKPMAGKDSWSGLDQVKRQGQRLEEAQCRNEEVSEICRDEGSIVWKRYLRFRCGRAQAEA